MLNAFVFFAFVEGTVAEVRKPGRIFHGYNLKDAAMTHMKHYNYLVISYIQSHRWFSGRMLIHSSGTVCEASLT